MVSTLKTRVFVVNTGPDATNPNAHRIEAAYYKTEDGFTTFKDVDNQAVFTVRDHHLITVERADGAEPLIAGFNELLVEARQNGCANGRIGTEVSESPDGVVTETGYEITVALAGGVDTTRSRTRPVEFGSSNSA